MKEITLSDLMKIKKKFNKAEEKGHTIIWEWRQELIPKDAPKYEELLELCIKLIQQEYDK